MATAELLASPELDEHRARVEVELRKAVSGEDAFLTEVATHLIEAGGHRWRPTLTILSALAAGGQVTDEVIRGACAVELVHLGSLYHDDVMDEADVRRGVQSVNSRWGNLVAILAGDFLLAKASEIAASLGTEIAALLARTIGRLCEGQVLELQTAFDVDRSEEAYFASIAGKTAALFSTSCRIGGLVADAPPATVHALTYFGEAFGMAFQIIDDINDLTLSAEELGKPAAHDISEGVYTLPVLRSLGADDGAPTLRGLLGRRLTPSESAHARALILEREGVESALASAQSWAARADAALDQVGPAKTVLRRLATDLCGRGASESHAEVPSHGTREPSGAA